MTTGSKMPLVTRCGFGLSAASMIRTAQTFCRSMQATLRALAFRDAKALPVEKGRLLGRPKCYSLRRGASIRASTVSPLLNKRELANGTQAG